MSGHSKWKQIKHKKAIADQKRGQAFGKILAAITMEARQDNDPSSNIRLRNLIDKAKQQNVPKEKIERALNKTSRGFDLEKIMIEAYGPGGVAILIEAATDNSNRTISEVRHILNKHNARVGEPGSVKWIFEGSESKFKQTLNVSDKKKLDSLIQEIKNHPDVEGVVDNNFD